MIASRSAVGAAPGQVRRARRQRQDSQQPAVRLEDPDPERDGDVDPAGPVDLHPVGTAGLARVEPGEDAARAGLQAARRLDVEGPDVIARGVADVKRSLVG